MAENRTQTRSSFINENIEQIFLRVGNFLAGEIDHSKRIFYSVPRTDKNLFFLFDGGRGGLGLNSELLDRTDFDIIKIMFNKKIYTMSRMEWLNKGTVSRFNNFSVDRQVILGLSDLEQSQKELELFKEVECG